MTKTLDDFVHLTAIQKRVLTCLNQEEIFYKHFYFTGGTLLKALDIVPRQSNDLDFFTFAHLPPLQFSPLLKGIDDILKRELKKDTLSVTSKGFLHNPSGILLDFILDTIEPIDAFVPYANIETASLKDIAAHKASALCSRDEIKDLIDLTFLTKKKGWLLKDLAKFAERKFQIGTITEEKLFEELLAKKKMFTLTPDLFLWAGKENVRLVKQQLEKLLTCVKL